MKKQTKSASEKRERIVELLLIGWRRRDIAQEAWVSTNCVTQIAYQMRNEGRLKTPTVRIEDEHWHWPPLSFGFSRATRGS